MFRAVGYSVPCVPGQMFRDALLSAEPIVPELDRNARALMPSQAARQVALPPDFFAISQDELKREQQLR